MNPEHWKKIKLILEEAIEISPASRQAFLEKNCNGDKTLQREIESLLEFEADGADVLEQDAFSTVLENGSASKNQIGKQIGRYKIADELGAGGMGAVFLAERADGEFSQKVALKLIKRGMDSDAVLRRFLNERQILASLKHPNIAHLVDGGTTDDNLPFFVMEYVEGVSIIEYAEMTNLDLEERLNLFRDVCAAVSFAHQNLVIHRDLKPSNVLVTKDGKVKLLDFGIAKLLKSDDARQTATQQFVFTPEYASPEQVRGEKLTTATDIYSLGVILYELLTGNRPYRTDSKNIGEIIKAVCETQPDRPSSVVSGQTNKNNGQKTNDEGHRTNQKSKIKNQKSLRGDLDNIILKALRKEPERRYSSVEQFAEDVRRHQVGLPVTASADTWKYRASKFAQRNRATVAAVGFIFLTLIAGLGATLYQANVARRERAKAEQRLNDVRKLASSFMFEINDEITKSPVKARQMLVEKALEYLDKLAAESGDNLELQRELAASYERIGNIQSQLFKPTTGKTSEALSSHQKALQIREKIFAAEPNAKHAIELSTSFVDIGDIFLVSGNLAETRENYRAAARVLEPQLLSDPQNLPLKVMFANCLTNLGQADLRSGLLTEALENYEKALQTYKILAAQYPNEPEYERNIGITFSFIGFVKMELGKTDEAVKDYGSWLEIEKKIFDPNNARTLGNLSTANVWFGVALSNDGKMPQAIPYFTEAVKLQEKVWAADKGNLGEEYTLADCYLEFGKAAARNNLSNEAVENLTKAMEIYRKIRQKDNKNLMVQHRIANAQRFLADAYFQKNNLAKAWENYEQSLAVFKESTAADTENVDWQQDLAMNYQRIGEFALKKNDKVSALTNFETALPIFERLTAKSPENVKRRRELETIKSHLAKLSEQPA